MTHSVDDTLESLRAGSAGLQALSPRERSERVGKLLDAWARPDSPWQRRLTRELSQVTGFSEAMVREGAAQGFAPYTASSLEALLQAEQPTALRGPALCTAILAGSIPMPTLVAAAAPLVLGFGVVLKPSASDPVSPALVARSVAALDPLLGRCVAAVPISDPVGQDYARVLGVDTVVATGSDESVAAIEDAAPATTRVVTHGHRFSAAVIRPGEGLEVSCRALARDVALWDQLGCLSPLGVWVIGETPAASEAVAEAVAGALATLETRWPRSPAGASASLLQDARDVDSMRAAGDSALGFREGTGWCVVRERDATLRAVPLLRYLRVYPASSVEEVVASLGVDAEHLAAVGVDGLDEGERNALAALRPSRICALGAMQTPPLAWRRDHLEVVGSLTPLEGPRD